MALAHGLEECRRGAGDDLDIDFRASRGIGGEDRRQTHRRGRLERPDDDLSARHGGVRRGLLRFRHQPADTLGVGQKLATGAGQAHAAAVAMKQRHAKLGLEQADALGHVGLHRVEPLRRLGDAARLRHRREDGEIAGVHGSAPPAAAITKSDGFLHDKPFFAEFRAA